MSTWFYWDDKKKKVIFVRYGFHTDGYCCKYVFNKEENLIKFLQEDREKIIYDEYDTPYTIGSVRREIINSGVIVISYFDDEEGDA